MGQWVYLTRHCLTLQFWHQVFSLLCAWVPSLAAVTNGLSVCMGALGAFVTIQYFALVVPAEGFKEECKQWAEKGVNFREVQHVLHDLCLRSTSTLRETLSFPGDMAFGMFYSTFYIVVFFFNYKLTGRWPYLFMEHEFGTDVKKWSVFILKQIIVITLIIVANWGALLQETAQLHEMQMTLETGYQELNQQRRSMDSLRQGVERQQKSLEAIQAENARLKGEVLELRQKCQAQVAQNATLSQGIAQRRQARADGNTQAALLQAVLKPQMEGTNDELARMETELKICRAQISSVLQENEALQRTAAAKKARRLLQRYDPQALADPFLTFSWYLHKKSGHDAEGWHSCGAAQGKPFDEPLDPQKVPVLEMIWEHLYPQMKRIGSIFHALEARDNSWAMDMRRSLTEEMMNGGFHPRTQAPNSGNQQTSGNRRLSRGAYRTAAAKCSPVSAYLHVKVSQELRQRVAQEEEERTIEIAKSDILGELEELKRRRRDLSLELELRDYVTLASMKEKEADWWGQAARNAAAYGQLDAKHKMATWKPAPEDCAPLRLRIFGYAGRPWHVLKAVAFRGATFDAIDAPNLHEGVGLLGLSTWFDMLLKQVPHSYIQTRHCEDRLRCLGSEGSFVELL
eukprot:s2285_g2.t1